VSAATTDATLRVCHLRLHLEPERELLLPAHNKGNTLRGGFGAAFRRLVCVDLRWECAECSLRFTCAYTAVFNPFLPPDADRMTGNRDIPRPFVFKPPLSTQTRFAAGGALVFEMVVIGKAIDYLPYFVVAFRALGEIGLGLNRAPVRLTRVEALDATGAPALAYSGESNVMRQAQPIGLDLLAPVETSADDSALALRFLTPTTLRSGSTAARPAQLVRQPQFHHVVKRLRDRLNALATFFGNGPLPLDFKALGEAAEQVQTVEDHTQWQDRSRFSARRNTPHDLSGFTGRMTFRGNVARFLPLLRAGELVHVGKNAVFGNGWLQVQVAAADMCEREELTSP
jgi:hypothetical protein